MSYFEFLKKHWKLCFPDMSDETFGVPDETLDIPDETLSRERDAKFIRRFVMQHAEGSVPLACGQFTLSAQREARWEALKEYHFDSH